jgi:regulator of sigma E protease
MGVGELKSLLSGPWAIFLAVVFLCASIIVHELGHFLAAKWRGLVVERFSIGFGPKIWGWTSNGVDYRISAIPLGGYVALPQLAGVEAIEGESNVDVKKLPPLSVGNKIIVSFAGPLFNVLFAVILGVIIWFTGRPIDASQMTTTIGYVAKELPGEGDAKIAGPAWDAGLRPGDTIVAIDETKVADWTALAQAIATSSRRDEKGARTMKLSIVRNGAPLTLDAKPAISPDTGLREIGILPYMPAVIGVVYENSPAQRSGLKYGDRVIAVDGDHIEHIYAVSKIISKTPPAPHTLTVLRDGKNFDLSITPEMTESGGAPRPMIGVRWAPEEKVLVHETPLKQVGTVVYMTLDVLQALVNPKSDIKVSDMSGPVGIAHALFLSARESFALLMFFVLFININFAIVNLLPIPVLDGGHIMFAIVEKIRGRPIPVRFLAASQTAFILLLFGMMAYVTINDISREFDMAKDRREIRKAENVPDPVFKNQPSGSNSQQPAAAK